MNKTAVNKTAVNKTAVKTMPDTTVAAVRGIVPHLAKIPDETIQMYIEDAKLEMQSLKYSPRYEEKIMRYLASHYAALSFPVVKSESLDGLGSQDYIVPGDGKEGLSATAYGQEVARILKKSGYGMIVIS